MASGEIKGEVVGVQILRALAAIMVVLDHSAATVASPKYFSEEFLGGFLYRGASGVDLFFLISGFIITIVSLDSNYQAKVAVSDFFKRRSVRILPLMWLAILSYALMKTLGRGEIDVAAFARSMILSPVGQLEPMNIWTLRHELIFYTVFGVSLLGPRVFRPLLLVWGLSPIALHFIEAPEIIEKIGYAINIEFCAGVLLGLVWLRYPVTYSSIVHPVFVMCVAMVGLMGLGAAVDLVFDDVRKTAIATIFLTPVLAFGVWVACPSDGFTAAGRLLGNASYAIYLFHPHVLTASATVLSAVLPNSAAGLVLLLLATLSIFVGVLIHLLFEKPLLTFLSQRRARVAAA